MIRILWENAPNEERGAVRVQRSVPSPVWAGLGWGAREGAVLTDGLGPRRLRPISVLTSAQRTPAFRGHPLAPSQARAVRQGDWLPEALPGLFGYGRVPFHGGCCPHRKVGCLELRVPA